MRKILFLLFILSIVFVCSCEKQNEYINDEYKLTFIDDSVFSLKKGNEMIEGKYHAHWDKGSLEPADNQYILIVEDIKVYEVNISPWIFWNISTPEETANLIEVFDNKISPIIANISTQNAQINYKFYNSSAGNPFYTSLDISVISMDEEQANSTINALWSALKPQLYLENSYYQSEENLEDFYIKDLFTNYKIPKAKETSLYIHVWIDGNSFRYRGIMPF